MSRFKTAGNGRGPSQRQLRVGEQVRHALVTLLQRGLISDPAIDGHIVTVSEVRMSPDLKIATAFVSAMGHTESEALVKALARNARFLRGHLGPELRQLKYMPELRFRPDTAFENFAHIDEILHSPEVARDLDHDVDEGELG